MKPRPSKRLRRQTRVAALQAERREAEALDAAGLVPSPAPPPAKVRRVRPRRELLFALALRREMAAWLEREIAAGRQPAEAAAQELAP